MTDEFDAGLSLKRACAEYGRYAKSLGGAP